MMVFGISYVNINECAKQTLHKIRGIETFAIVNFKNHVLLHNQTLLFYKKAHVFDFR